MIKIFFYTVVLFIYYIVCIYIYILYNNYRNNKVEKELIELYKLIDNIVLYNEDIGNVNLLIKKINSKPYQIHLIRHLLEIEDRDATSIFIEKYEVLKKILNRRNEDEIDIAYKVYLIGQFKIKKEINYLIEKTKNKSIYVQINALKSLAELEDEKAFIKGIENLVNSGTLINEKIILDTIYGYKGDKNSLNLELEKKLKNNNYLAKIILSYFTDIKNINILKDVSNLLTKEDIDKELKIACIRYFMSINSIDIKNTLINLVKDEHWEIRAIAATALGNYYSEETKNALKISIQDRIWYVRQNSAMSLYKLSKNEEELIDIITGEDKYASDSLLAIISQNGYEKMPKLKNILSETKEVDNYDIIKSYEEECFA